MNGFIKDRMGLRFSRLVGCLVVMLVQLFWFSCFAEDKQLPVLDFRKIPVSPPPLFQPELPQRVQLENGLVLYLQPDHETPIIQVQIFMKGGALFESREKTGISSMLAKTWITGGTTEKTGDQIHEWMEKRGIRSFSEPGIYSVSLGFTCLREQVDESLQVFQKIVSHPQFRQEKIDLAKGQFKTGISMRNDHAQQVASRELGKLVYGENHPYSWQIEYATLNRIERKDLLAWHQEHFFSNQLIIGVSGDFDPKEMQEKIKTLFGSLKPGAVLQKQDPEIQSSPMGVYFVSRPEVAQSQVYLGQMGQTFQNPDFYALSVMNNIVGSSFSGRLFNHIRTQKGLAYSIFGGVGFGFRQPGVYQIGFGTNNTTVKKAITAVLAELQDLFEHPPTSDEVKRAKDELINKDIFRYETKKSILEAQISLELHGYPLDFWKRYPEQIKKVTEEDVKRVIEKYVKPNEFRLVVVGNEKEFDEPLSSLGLGPVKKIDITIPEESVQKITKLSK